MTSKYGFSVVAPMSVTVPSSTCGSSASCWALLKRWISSRNRTLRVPWRFSRSCASAMVARTSATPDMTADSEVKWAPISPASSRARLVLPVPGGPHSSSDDEVAAGDAPAERAAFADEVRLPDELVEVPRTHARGERLALGRWLEEGFGSGAGRFAARMACADGSAALRAVASPAKCDDRPRGRAGQDQRAADERDPPDVASHVGVFLGRARPRGWTPARPVRRCDSRPRALGRGLGLLLLGDDRRLELGRAGLLLVGQRDGSHRRGVTATGWVAGRVDAGSLERWALTGSGRAASGSLGHGLWRASIGVWSGRGRGRARAAGRAADGRG